MVSMASLEARDFIPYLLVILATITLLKHVLGPSKKETTSSPNSKTLPQPRGLPLIGNLHQIAAHPERCLSALATKHAAPLMMLRLGSVPTLVVSTAEAAHAVFQYNDRAMSGRPALYAYSKYSYGQQSISSAPSDTEFWRGARRACLSELLGAPRVRGFRTVRESEAAILVAAVADASATGSAVNMSHLVVATSSKIVRRIAFGGDFSMEDRVVPVLKEAENIVSLFWAADYFPSLGWLDTLRGLRRRLDKNLHELDAFYERVIEGHVNKGKSSGSDSGEEDLVDVLLRLHADPTQQSTFGTRSQIKGILVDMFIAGTETSSGALEWTMTELINNPEVLAKAQQEVRTAVGDKAMVEESDLPRLTYLSQVIKESMRLHPPVPLLLPRETTAPCTVNGCEIPAKTLVIINAKAIGMDATAWGPDAAKFLPERHGRDDSGASDTSFRLVPFGIKRRSCPGATFATAVVELLLANLLFTFDWRAAAPNGRLDVEEANGITVHRKNPLLLIAKRKGMH